MDIFCRSKHLINTFCVCVDGFQDLLKALHYSIKLLTFYLCAIFQCRNRHFRVFEAGS
jgi:hypothetical protein